jgi:hypothetical protein
MQGMKKIVRYTCLLLFIFGWSILNAQDNARTLLKDPKLTHEELALLLKAGEDNPSRPVIVADPKEDPSSLRTEKDFGETNARPAPVQDRAEIKPGLPESSQTAPAAKGRDTGQSWASKAILVARDGIREPERSM